MVILLININSDSLNYLGLSKGAVFLFCTYFTVSRVSVNCRNIKHTLLYLQYQLIAEI